MLSIYLSYLISHRVVEHGLEAVAQHVQAALHRGVEHLMPRHGIEGLAGLPRGHAHVAKGAVGKEGALGGAAVLLLCRQFFFFFFNLWKNI